MVGVKEPVLRGRMQPEAKFLDQNRAEHAIARALKEIGD
jgi:hypothetical protein